jgi:hypothetical protein
MNKTRSCISYLLAVSLSITSLTLFSGPALAQDDQDCKSIPKQIDDLVDKLQEVSERLGQVQERIDKSGENETRKHTLETDTATAKRAKLGISNLVVKLSACCRNAPAVKTDSDKNCRAIPAQIDRLVDKVQEVGERIGVVQERIDKSGENETRKHTLETDTATMRRTKLAIANLVVKLAACCKQPQETTPAPKPEPSPKPTPYVVENYKPAEVFVGYQFQRAPDEPGKNLNGINGQAFYDFKKHIGIGADVAWVFGSDRIGTNTDVKLHRFTGLFGPRFTVAHPLHQDSDKPLALHFPILIGFDHDSTEFHTSLSNTKATSTAFMMSFGANLDVMIKKNFGVRVVEFDYQPTHFGGFWQNNFRIATGVVFRFGKEKELPTW